MEEFAVNPMMLFQPGTDPRLQQAMSQLNILLGGLGRSPAAKPLAPSLGMPPKSPQPADEQTLLGGISG